MAVNLIELLKNEFSGEVASKVASAIGEKPAATQQALSGLIPAAIAALANRAFTTTGASDLVGLIRDTGLDGTRLASSREILASESGTAELLKSGGPLVASIFGGRQSAVSNWLSSFAGIGGRSASTLLALAAPLILNSVAKQASGSGGLNAGALAGLLAGQAGFLRSAAPPGVATALGLRGFDLPSVGAAAAPAIKSGGFGSALKWLVPLVALVAVAWGVRSCQQEPAAPESTAATTPPAAAPAPAAPETVKSIYGIDLGALVKRMLPGGVELSIPEKGVESQLITSIEDANQPVSPTQWFNLDRVEFETGSAALKPSAQEQINNVAAVLKAFPNVAIKIGGYTDDRGDDASNVKLSQARAANTMAALVAQGVAKERLEAEGYGEQHPVASNDTDEGRQRNRRIDVRVTRK